MPVGAIQIRYRGPSPRIAKRRMGPILKAAFAAIGAHWHRVMRPRHFTHAARRKYDYQPRGGEPGSGRRFRGSYTERKLRIFGHTRPLEYSGESRQLTRIRDVRATSKRARVVMRASGFNLRRSAAAPDMRRELTTITDEEARELADVFDAAVQRGLDRMGHKEVVRA